ncbi:xanthine dehydrogenase family protein molybdopterin-binding subunit [Autumnicola musiva]|uniref:Molybdopterin cofactor-binding domain-containing protein n=1 Tax=Autumnicola musiva TaxID=3075589 RepID=A0ABU3DBF3_9FLAO|nr:molybdopterin cofactor-binding domain-containing protein [Zunongwangia sp. F117]MDT0678695.1 molybdopterin cofactor-binding domain-containing protein [Zunongwangia sp. F117]
MAKLKTSISRRSFLKTTALAGGGMMIGFNWLLYSKSKQISAEDIPEEWFNLNAYLKIAEDGTITIMAPNPEFGQNVKTSLPMIVADELDVDWDNVVVEQAPFNTELYTRQFAGGSQSVRQGWNALRTAGATARQMLVNAAGKAWNLPASEITTEKGILKHPDGKTAGYGEMAAAASKMEIPETVDLKKAENFTIISTSKKNVELPAIVSGKPLFGLDYKIEGMQYATVAHPPAFGMRLKTIDDSEARKMPGITDIFTIQVYNEDYELNIFDTVTFNKLAVVVGNSTWQVIQAKKALKLEWEPFNEYTEKMNAFGNKSERTVPSGLESTAKHYEKMETRSNEPAKVLRKDGDPENAFKNAAKVIESTYTAPFLAHNAMEPINFFADVTENKAVLAGPLQAPQFTENTVAARLGMDKENIEIIMTRMGGGFGRRAYSHELVEAAVISQKIKNPVKLFYTREADMTYGIYRPAYHINFRAALDANNNLIAYHIRGGGIPESPIHENRFPAGAVDNYLAESWELNSNITIGAFRAPRSNFMGGSEQAFLDEVAIAAGKDPIDFRIELFEKAKNNPVGKDNDYDPERYMGVLKLVRQKSKWDSPRLDVHRGVAAYYCHNSYVAHVVNLKLENDKPVFDKIYSGVDCGIVINEDAAKNMVEGAITDGLGNVMFGKMSFEEGVPQSSNFYNYKMIRINEAPKDMEVHFVQNEVDPSGLGEPPFPPIFAAFTNAYSRAKNKRFYNHPILEEV